MLQFRYREYTTTEMHVCKTCMYAVTYCWPWCMRVAVQTHLCELEPEFPCSFCVCYNFARVPFIIVVQYLCMYVCMYVCVCVCMLQFRRGTLRYRRTIPMYVHVCVCVCIHTYLDVCVSCIFRCVCMCVCVCVHHAILTDVCTHAKRMHVCIIT